MQCPRVCAFILHSNPSGNQTATVLAHLHCVTQHKPLSPDIRSAGLFANMLAQIFLPLYLPVLQLVTLATTPATALYAIAGLLASPIIIPLLIFKNIITLVLFTPLLLCTLPVAIPVGGVLAFLCIAHEVICSFIVVFTPLLWPLYFLCKWWKFSCVVSKIVITDTIMPWLVPLRFTFLAAILPKLLFKA